jgi:hypothetical protein
MGLWGRECQKLKPHDPLDGMTEDATMTSMEQTEAELTKNKVAMTTREQMEAELTKNMVAEGYTHYKARAEDFDDVIDAFKFLEEYNNTICKKRNNWGNCIRYTDPSIKRWMNGDVDFDFWTPTPIRELLQIWHDKAGSKYEHIVELIVMTIKPYDEFTGEIDETVWAELK